MIDFKYSGAHQGVHPEQDIVTALETWVKIELECESDFGDTEWVRGYDMALTNVLYQIEELKAVDSTHS